MKQIARACGFSGTQHFRLVFQRTAGMAPAEYRQAHAPGGDQATSRRVGRGRRRLLGRASQCRR